MLPKDILAEKSYIEIFDADGRYIDCPGIGGTVIYNDKGRRYLYEVLGFDLDSPHKDWPYCTDYINPVIQYIGKVKEQKPIIEMKPAEESLGISSEEYNDIVNECLYGESKTVDKVEPKFKNEQWIVWQNKCYKVNYNGCGYELIDQNGLSTSLEYGTVDTSARLWDNTKDAKDGDVLASDNSIFIFQEEYIAEKPIAYCGLMNGRFLVDGEDACWTNERYYPATKEQRDALMKAMTDAGWKFDFEKKELKKISQRMLSAEAKEALYDKSVWNEDDDDMLVIVEGWLDTLCEYLEDSSFECIPDVEFCINWIKSLKDRAQSKQEWSEDDETKMRAALAFIKSEFPKKGNEEIMEGTIEWLKSLKQRIGWKPSDEQMIALSEASGIVGMLTPRGMHLQSLYNDLKKLK